MDKQVSHERETDKVARVVESVTALDRATAAAVRGSATARSDRFHAWPANRRTEEVIAERMLMAALLNYRRALDNKADFADFKSHAEMTDIECGFYETAVATAYAAIWGGR